MARDPPQTDDDLPASLVVRLQLLNDARRHGGAAHRERNTFQCDKYSATKMAGVDSELRGTLEAKLYACPTIRRGYVDAVE